MKTIAVIGATLTGNKGAASMLISLAQNRNQFCPEGCLIDCLTIYYQEDKKFNFYDDLNIIKCTPFDIICIAMPLSALYYLFSWITPIKNILLKNKVLRIVSKADLVVNIAGISYSDGRGLILLYNIACDIVPILLRKKNFKYSQAIGPFKQFINRTAAKAILKKVTKIAARGEKTIENLNQLGLTNYEYSADGAFSMTLKEKNISQPIRDFVSKMKKSSLIKVGIAPSSVVLQYCQRLKIPYLDLITNLISKNENKYCFILFPYCARQKSHKPKNNDRQAIKDLSSKLAPSENILLLDNEFSAEDLRFLIQNLDILISSRYHALVCALSQEVVPLVIGWSHKYTETLRLFSLQDLAIDYAHLKKNLLEEKFTTIVSDINGYKNTIRAHLTKVKESSKVNFTIIKELLEN